MRLGLWSLLYFIIAVLHSSSSLKNRYRWNPEDEHPCNIPRIEWDSQLFRQQFPPDGKLPALYPSPIVIIYPTNSTGGDTRTNNQHFRHITHRDRILQQFPQDFTVTLSSSNALSEHRRITTFQTYLQESWEAQETFPEQLSNNTWYLFGETYSQAWHNALLQYYDLPPCSTCTRDKVALSFGAGNRGSGVQWHTHGPGFSEAIHGRKHWILLPPHVTKPPQYHKDQSSRKWMEDEYEHTRKAMKDEVYECTRKYT